MKTKQHFQINFLRTFFKSKITEERTFFTLTLIVGVLAGIITVIFENIVLHITQFTGTNLPFTLETFLMGGGLIILSGIITTRFFPSTSGSGVPNVKIAIAVYHGKLNLKDTIAKFFTSILSLGSGISLGKEGPIVTITSGIGSFLGHGFNLSKKRVKGLVAVGSAAGIAAAFNAPISAVVFTLEEVVGDLNAKILGSIIISSVAAAVTAQLINGHHLLASHLDYKINNPKELFFYFIIGLLAAICGPLWMKTTLKLRILFKEVLRDHRLSIIVIAFLVIGFLSLIHPAVLGSGKPFLEKELLSLVLDWRTLALVFVIKFLATSICYSAGPSGGLFMPTLMVGATLGSFVGALGSLLFPEIVSSSAGTYALVGMGAYFVTVIRAPFTSILIVFELTRNYNIILPVLIANVVAYMLSEKITSGSIYEEISEQDGIHLPTRDDDDILDSSTVEDALVKDIITFKHDDTVKDVYLKLKDSDITGFPVLKNGLLYGIIAKRDVLKEMSQRNHKKLIIDVCQSKLIKVYPDQTLLVALHLLNRFQISRLPVVSRLDSKNLIGIITVSDILDNFGYKINSSKYKLTIEDEQYTKMIEETDQLK